MSVNEPTEIRKEVHRSVGRNLLNFQRFEFLLKHLLGRSGARFESSGLEAALAQRQDKVSDQTLGMLVRQLFEEFLFSHSSPPPNELPPIQKRHQSDRELAFAFTTTVGNELHAEWKARLETLVNDRNRLVHHFWDDFPPGTLDTPEGCQKALAGLEEQRNRIRQEVEALKVLIDHFYETSTMLKERLKDPKFCHDLYRSANDLSLG